MRKKTAGLYDPYLDTLGGGEKHILQILQVLSDDGYEINIFWNENLTSELQKKFALQYFKSLKFIPNVFYHPCSIANSLKTFQTLKTFDYFFYVTDGSYFISSAKKNFVFCMVPQKSLYPHNVIDKFKTLNYRFVSNSRFTHDWMEKWGVGNDYIYPYIDGRLLKPTIAKKEKFILSVGRFFSHLHTKQHRLIIAAYRQLKKNEEFADYKLILAGGLKKEDQKYFQELKNYAKNDPTILFKPNINLNELYELYKLSHFFWHFAGYGIDENLHPEQVEHLGITPLEAMASGCLTFCYRAGGPKELIADGKNGFLFSDIDELVEKVKLIANNQIKQNSIMKEATDYIRNNFSYPVFQSRVKKLILNQ